MVYYNEYHKVKKITQVVLTASVFAFLISKPSSFVPFLVNSYDYLASNFTVKLFSYTSERNYIFLLCNGILVLIIQTSGLITKIMPVRLSSYTKDVRINGHDHDHVEEELVDHGEPRSATIVIRKVDVFEESDCVGKDGIDNNPSQEIKKPEKQEEEEEEGIDEGMNIDELNKKCEEFIKKMKQEILGLN